MPRVHDRPEPTHPAVLERWGALLNPKKTALVEYLEAHVILGTKMAPVRFKLHDFQKRLCAMRDAAWANGRAFKCFEIKPRQIGSSELFEAWHEEGMQRHPGYRGLVVAHEKEASAELFTKVHYLSEQVPWELRKQHDRASGLVLRLRHQRATGAGFDPAQVRVMTARKRQGSRSGTFNGMHLSEVAHWEHTKGLSGFLNSVHDEPGNWLVGETTAFGHNIGYTMWHDAVAGFGGWCAFFLAWWEHAPYRRPFPNAMIRDQFIASLGRTRPERYGGREELDLYEGRIGYDLNGELRGFQPLAAEQLNWRRWAIDAQCEGDLRTFWQEFPSFPEQAFLSTGRPVVNVANVRAWLPIAEERENTYQRGRLVWTRGGREIGEQLGEDDRREELEVEFREDTQGDWTVMQPPLEGMRCTYGADCAEGISPNEQNTDPDFHALYIGNALTKDVLARYRSRVPEDGFAEEIYKASRWYGGAWGHVEANAAGLAVIRCLLRWGFSRILRRPRPEATAEGKRSAEARPGYLTTKKTKPQLVNALDRLTRTCLLPPSRKVEFVPFDAWLSRECLTFVRSKMGKMGAEPGKHDDLFIARALLAVATDECDFHRLTAVPPSFFDRVRALGLSALDPTARHFDSAEALLEYEEQLGSPPREFQDDAID